MSFDWVRMSDYPRTFDEGDSIIGLFNALSTMPDVGHLVAAWEWERSFPNIFGTRMAISTSISSSPIRCSGFRTPHRPLAGDHELSRSIWTVRT
jgi:hypothetical protein